MATYKLIQDVEAEDHILGPLTLRQFIFALIGIFCWYLTFTVFVKSVYFLLIITAPPALFFTFFAIPFGRDQPTEVWALAKLRFWFKPRRRIWDQSGVKELVTITVPKKVEHVLTKGFTQSEVQSRLKALASTLDTRGWAVKNVNLQGYASNGAMAQASDRLIDIGTAPQEVPSYEVQASDDILDEASNPVARQFQTMITKSAQEHRQQLIDELNEIRTGQGAVPSPAQTSSATNGWFMSRPTANSGAAGAAASTALPVPQPVIGSNQPSAYANMRTLQPAGSGPAPQQPAKPADNNGSASGAAGPDPAILSLANNNDLNVSTLAREAYKAKHDDESPDEVVVSLH